MQNLKIAIHYAQGTFAERWIEYCKEKDIEYKVVNAYDSDIIQQIRDCNVFMWHHHHTNYKDALSAKQLLYSLQMAGKKVFPDFRTGWHFDDKVGQKYLLEAIEAPLVPSYVFYTKEEALKWIAETSFPKVFKLRGGAGSDNVRLVRSKRKAIKLVNIAFGKGFSQYARWSNLRDRFHKWQEGKLPFVVVCRGVGRLLIPSEFAKMHSPEKGYVYFQDFLPQNECDQRIVVVNTDKAFGIKRLVRKNDFRASGSGNIIYDKTQLDENCVRIAFSVAKRLKAQSIAFDFIYDQKRNPLIVEISYGYAIKAYYDCEGYWTDDMIWHSGSHFDIEGWILEGVINGIK